MDKSYIVKCNCDRSEFSDIDSAVAHFGLLTKRSDVQKNSLVLVLPNGRVLMQW